MSTFSDFRLTLCHSPAHDKVVNTILEIAQSKDIRVVFTNDAAHSADILHGLAMFESGCTRPMDLTKDWLGKHEKQLNFLLSVPAVNFSTAVRLITQFGTMKELINATVSQLQTRVTGLSQESASSIVNFFRLSVSGSVHNS
jgi:ERCC4-type nuclease